MAIVVMLLYIIELGGIEDPAEEYIVEMLVEQPKVETPKEVSQKELIKSHRAYNKTAKPSYGAPKPLKTLAEILEEEDLEEENIEEESPTEDTAYSDKVKSLIKKRKEKKQLVGEKESKKESFTNYLAEKRTSISFSLLNRNSRKLPPPIYTCLEGGKVVVNVKVDANGHVVDAFVNQKSSSTTNGCLVDNAVAYALKARFSPSLNDFQKGTITYLFQEK